MNYYEHHIGDYAQATAHLSILEDGVYSRLLRKYYADELPLPRDQKKLERLIGARSAAEKTALKDVLEEFFEPEEDGWHNERADREIGAYQKKQAGAEGRREGQQVRKQRSREHRAQLCEQLRQHGITPKWNATIKELKADMSRVTGCDSTVPVTPPVTPPVTDPVRLSQSPVPIHQSPVTTQSGVCVTGTGGNANGKAEDPRARWLAVRAAYPAHAHPEHDWQLAEREAVRAVDDGLCTWDQWFNAATRYAAQVRATGREGTQFVTKPSNWFRRDKRPWAEEFTVPAQPTKPRRTTAGASLNLATIEADIKAGLRDAEGAWIGPPRGASA